MNKENMEELTKRICEEEISDYPSTTLTIMASPEELMNVVAIAYIEGMKRSANISRRNVGGYSSFESDYTKGRYDAGQIIADEIEKEMSEIK